MEAETSTTWPELWQYLDVLTLVLQPQSSLLLTIFDLAFLQSKRRIGYDDTDMALFRRVHVL